MLRKNAVPFGTADNTTVMEIPPEKSAKKKGGILELLRCALLTMIVVFIIQMFFVRVSVVQGDSMLPTVRDGDYVLYQVFNYTPAYDDIVLCKNEEMFGYIIKRIIGLPGDTIEIDSANGVVYRNGIALDEPYTNEPTYTTGDMTGPVIVEEDHVFVMGDNRNKSADSRYDIIGQVSYEDVIARYLFTIVNFSKNHEI